MKTISLEELLQKHFGLKGNLYLKRPIKDKRGNIVRAWTSNGFKAYDRFTKFLTDLGHHVYSYIDDDLGKKIGNLPNLFDDYEKSSIDL